MRTGCIILAGGAGKRMKSEKPKVLLEVLQKPMLGWVLDAAEEFGFDEIAVVTGFEREQTEGYLRSRGGDIHTYYQPEQKGTGDAVMMARELIERCELVCVLCGDAPFADAGTLKDALSFHMTSRANCTVISAKVNDPTGYGRIIRERGFLGGIREQKDCSPEEAAICEVNSGMYWFNSVSLLDALPKLKSDNAAGEYYLTDCVELIGNCAAYTSENPDVILGANTGRALWELNEKARMKVLFTLMDEGVRFVSTDGVIIGKDVKIGADTTILPGTIILGNTVIGKNCHIGADCRIENCKIGNNVTLNSSQCYDSVIEDRVSIGPFSQLRPGSVIKENVRIGDFVEIKNSVLGENTSASHLTYIGDSDVGRGVNFGCGCVTANYDGINKNRTVIGDNAFIGCNTNLVAPVTVGENAATAAGSTITKPVPANSLAVERGQMRIKENWLKNSQRKKRWNGDDK